MCSGASAAPEPFCVHKSRHLDFDGLEHCCCGFWQRDLARSVLLMRLGSLLDVHRRRPVREDKCKTSDDGVKALLAGADAVQLVSAILRHGPAHFRKMRDGLERWMEWHHFDNISRFRGRLSLQDTEDPEAHERGDYIRVLHSWKV